MSARDKIRNFVVDHQGCKEIKVFTDSDILSASRNESVLVRDVIDEMVESGELIAIEYVLPHLEDRVKRFLFPAGTKFTSDTLAMFFNFCD